MTRVSKLKIKKIATPFTGPRGLKHGSMPPHLLIKLIVSKNHTRLVNLSHMQVQYNKQLFVFI